MYKKFKTLDAYALPFLLSEEIDCPLNDPFSQ
jgi:hypothetical protein